MTNSFNLVEKSSRDGSPKYSNDVSYRNKNADSLAYKNLKSPQTLQWKNPSLNRILFNLPEKDYEKILPDLERVYLPRNEYVYQADDFMKYIYFPESAVISECQFLEDGKTIEVAMTGREGFVGVSPVFKEYSSQNWMCIAVAGNALRIETEIFQQIFNDCDSLKNILFDFVNFYIKQISQRVICNSYHKVEERLCLWLLMLQERTGKNELKLTQEQIARFLGVHRPSITHIMKWLREEAVVDYTRGKISVLNRRQLENSACVCYSNTKKIR